MAGRNRRQTDLIVVGQTDTHARQDIGLTYLVSEAQRQGIYSDRGPLGIHFLIRRSGAIEVCRDLSAVGHHGDQVVDEVAVHVQLVGGRDRDGQLDDNFSGRQLKSLADLCRVLFKIYPAALVVPSEFAGCSPIAYDIWSWEDSVFGSGHEARAHDYRQRLEAERDRKNEQALAELEALYGSD